MAFRSALRRLLGRTAVPRHDDDEMMFRRVVEQSGDVICRVVNGKISYVSPSASVVFGWDPQELIGTDGLHTIYADDRHIVEDAIGRLISGGQSQVVTQERTVCGDGSLKWTETVARMEGAGSILETILVMRDISECKVMMYVRFPLSLRNVENLLFERWIDISHETVGFWWSPFGNRCWDEVCHGAGGFRLTESRLHPTDSTPGKDALILFRQQHLWRCGFLSSS